MTNQETADALRIAADFVERQEDSDSWTVSISYDEVTISRYFYDLGDGEGIRLMNESRRALGGKWEKRTNEYDFALMKSIGEHVTVELQTSRSAACTPRVVGTETVEVRDYSAAPTKTVERNVVEWDCDPILDV